MLTKHRRPFSAAYFSIATIWLSVLACAGFGGDDVTSAGGEVQPGGETAQPGLPFQGYAAITGPVKTVYDWTTQKCETTDVPDLSARAFVDAAGQVQLIASIDQTRRSVGPDLNQLTHQCDVVLRSDIDPNPANFNDHQWISATYTEDGQTIYAYLHNEFHGNEHSAQCSPNDYFPCWYNAITLATSRDAGASYSHAHEPPGHLVASLPYQFEARAGPYGIMAGSNILKAADGYYYMLVRVDAYQSGDQHVCAMRTTDLSDPASWRAWDGDGFGLSFLNPYSEAPASPGTHICAAISLQQIDNMHESITYNTFLKKYVLFGTTGKNTGADVTWGFFYSFSDDLVHWSDRQLLAEMPLGGVEGMNGPDVVAYPSLMDPESDSRNFETAGQNAYVYYTLLRIRSGAGFWDRDLVRFPIEFFTSKEEAESADARTVMTMEAALAGDHATVDGQLLTFGGAPVSGAAIQLVMTPEGGAGVPGIYTVTGTVPAGAREATAAVRINGECGCEGIADISIYEFAYLEGTDPDQSQLRNFSSGSAGPGVWGSAPPRVEASDQGSGRMLHFDVARGEDSMYNASHFTVSPGATYTFTVNARVSPGSKESGYFALIFLTSGVELERVMLPLAAQSAALGQTRTDAQGRFSFPGIELPSLPAVLGAQFPGDDRLWPAEVARRLE